MLNALRLTDGFELELFSERTGLELSIIETQLEAVQRKGLLKIEQGYARPTNEGRLFLNDLLEMFLD